MKRYVKIIIILCLFSCMLIIPKQSILAFESAGKLDDFIALTQKNAFSTTDLSTFKKTYLGKTLSMGATDPSHKQGASCAGHGNSILQEAPIATRFIQCILDVETTFNEKTRKVEVNRTSFFTNNKGEIQPSLKEEDMNSAQRELLNKIAYVAFKGKEEKGSKETDIDTPYKKTLHDLLHKSLNNEQRNLGISKYLKTGKIDNETKADTTIITQANAYNNKIKNGDKFYSLKTAPKLSNKTVKLSGDAEAKEYTYIGPFKIVSGGGIKPSGIQCIGAKGGKRTVKGIVTTANGTNPKKVSTIQDKKQFWVVVVGKLTKMPTITLEKKLSYIANARVVILINTSPTHSVQHNAVFSGATEKTATLTLELTGAGVETGNGNINIEKKSSTTGEPMKDVQFTIQNSEGEYYTKAKIFSSTFTDDCIWITGANGRIEIADIESGIYTVTEIGVLNNGYGQDNYGYLSSGEEQTEEVEIGGTVTFIFENVKHTGKLVINKIDKGTGQPMSRIGFTLQMVSPGDKYQKYIHINDKGNITYESTPQTLLTTVDGKLVIDGIWEGAYKLTEVENPYFGYEVLPKIIEEQLIVQGHSQEVTIIVENERKYIKLSGYVWEDRNNLIGKKWEKDNLYTPNSNDKKLQNVEVILKKSDGTILDTQITNENGTYVFGDFASNQKPIEIADLHGAYIEFTYNGMCYQSVEVNANQDNGSKATDEPLRKEFNEAYSTITKGKAQNGNYNLVYDYQDHKAILTYGEKQKYVYGYEGQKYPISGISNQYTLKANTLDASPDKWLGQSTYTIEDVYKNGIQEISNINLGLTEREMPDIALVQDIQDVKIGLNGYMHTYQYAQRFSKLNQEIAKFVEENKDTDKIFNIGVNFGEKYGPEQYTATIYSSDIVYNNQEGNQGKLGVWINYEMRLMNQTASVKTVVNELYNYYDSDYEVDSVTDKNGKHLTYTIDEGYVQNNRKRMLIHPEEGISIEEQGEQKVKITYRVKNEAVSRMLNHDQILNSITEVVSYSSYDKDNHRYAGIDVDSEPNNAIIGKTETYEDDIDQAPSIILQSRNTRKIEGTVWEENAIEELLKKTGYDKERLGNGQYDEGQEGIIENVQVELLKIEENKMSWASLYQATGQVVTQAKTKTDGKGYYCFDGIIPGRYVIRFTYGNNSIVCEPNGNKKTIQEKDGVEYYKSTLYRTKNIGGEKQSFYQEEDPYWFKDSQESANRLSDARDDRRLVQQRINDSQEINYNTVIQESKIQEIQASTDPFVMEMDFNQNDTERISQFGQPLKFVFEHLDFGIIRRPKQNLSLKKEIAHVKVTLANQQTIIDGDPRKGGLKHLKYSPDGNVQIELDSEIMQGATLTLTYDIIVDNTQCEIDYHDINYYDFGTQNRNKWKVATIKNLFEYPSNEFNFEQKYNQNWAIVDVKQLDNNKLKPGLKKKLEIYQTILQTQQFAMMKPGEKKIEKVILSKLIANTEEDLSFDNDIEVNTYLHSKMDKTIPGNYDPADSHTKEKDNDHKNLVLTVPTGENREYLPYIILAIVSCIILVVGIISIKRKVLQ